MDEQFYKIGLDFEAEGYSSDVIAGDEPPSFPTTTVPWDIWRHAVRCAMSGNFEYIPSIVGLQQEYTDYVFRYTASIFLEDSITVSGLNCLHQRMQGCEDPLLLVDYARIMAATGRLELIPLILDQYEKVRTFNESEVITVCLSWVIEPELGEVCLPPDDLPIRRYRAIVLNRLNELRASLPDPTAPVFKGRTFSVPRLGEHLLQCIERRNFLPEHRQKFEAATGVDCSSFYKNRIFQPLAAASIIERFLGGDTASRYELGARYFFGHRIPD